MRNWDTRDESASDAGCEWEQDWGDVRRVCSRLGLPCRLVRPLPQWSARATTLPAAGGLFAPLLDGRLPARARGVRGRADAEPRRLVQPRDQVRAPHGGDRRTVAGDGPLRRHRLVRRPPATAHAAAGPHQRPDLLPLLRPRRQPAPRV